MHEQHRPRRRKEVKLQVRVERPLAERLQRAADATGVDTSDQLRRILDAVLPPLPEKHAA